MAKIRIYELAKQLNVTNKLLLEKLNELNVPAKNHMASVDESIVDRIKEYMFGPKEAIVTEKRVNPTVIRRRKRPVKKIEEVSPAMPDTGTVPASEISVKADDEPKAGGETKDVVKIKEEEPLRSEEESPEHSPVHLPERTESPPEEPVTDRVRDKVSVPEPEKVEDLTRAKPQKKVKAKRKVKRKREEPATIIKMPEKPESEKGEAKPRASEELATGEAPEEREIDTYIRVVPKKERIEEVPRIKKKKEKGKREEENEEVDKRLLRKRVVLKKKAIVEKADLYDLKGVKALRKKKDRKAKASVKEQKTRVTTPKAIKRRIKIGEAIVVSELAKRMGIKAAEMIKQLMSLGVMATLNQTIDFDTASLVASEFNYEVEKDVFEEEAIIQTKQDDPGKLKPRPPVITIMGHVDHGKTSLLDVIRKTNIIESEAGGITQHIGAYHVKLEKGEMVFLDTPGHEAFTAMRARGAKVTDIVILVVAADDGVMPQTIEAINHAKAANVPIIVAINKIDKPNAEPERVKRELAEQGLTPEEWGGDTIFVEVSAKLKKGIDELLEMILLQAELLELKANPDKLAEGYVIESKLDTGRGAVATVLVQGGTLHTGDPLVCGVHYGKVRAMFNDRGKRIDNAGPSMPVEIQGLSGVPMAGDKFIVLEDEKKAKYISSYRMERQRADELTKSSRLNLEQFYEQMKKGSVIELNLIIRADVQGSIEAITEALQKLSSSKVKVNIIHSGTGAITESDIMLANVSKAIVIGFNVRPNVKVQEVANEENVDIRFYDVIYDLIKDVKGSIEGLMEPTYRENILGRAEIREIFVIPKVGTIAGCYVTDGKLERGSNIRLIREGVVIHTGRMSSLRRFKDDVKEVQSGYECGVGIENYNDLKINDVIECYELEEIKPGLE
nr:translation initiation factor IF-2 [Desulfobacterales bacterium]